MIWPFGDIKPLSADVISVDFPWDFKTYSEKGISKSAKAQYDTMSLSEILEFAPKIGMLAGKDCLCLCWCCEWMQPSDRQAVLEAMGFTYKSTMIWLKETKNGKSRLGTGYRVRSMHEPVYIGTIGNPKHKAFPSTFRGVAREHSRKPEEFYQLVERCTPNAMLRLDLFSRQTRPHWKNWGKEKDLFDTPLTEPIRRAVQPKFQPPPEPMPLFPE